MYKKTKALEERLYKIHLDCAKTWCSMWPYMLSRINRNVDERILSRYHPPKQQPVTANCTHNFNI